MMIRWGALEKKHFDHQFYIIFQLIYPLIWERAQNSAWETVTLIPLF